MAEVNGQVILYIFSIILLIACIERKGGVFDLMNFFIAAPATLIITASVIAIIGGGYELYKSIDFLLYLAIILESIGLIKEKIGKFTE